MRSRWIPVVAFAMLVAAFAIDVATPQTLVVAVLFGVPIVVAALAESRKLTAMLVVLGLAADAAAGYLNGAHAGYHWDTIGLADRALAALSIVLVGYLSILVQERARRAGRAAAQEARARREAQLAGAVDRVRASLSPDLVVRAIVRESAGILGGDEARWIPVLRDGEWLSMVAGHEVVVAEPSARTEFVSLVRRALDLGDPEVLDSSDAFGRLVLDALSAHSALVVPLADVERQFGVLVLTAKNTGFDEAAPILARMYARAGVAALAQARLFAELAERNDELAERGAVIRDLVYALSHDLRTPLAALDMTLVQARDGAYGELPPRYREILGGSVSAVSDLQRLADTLLRVARFESGERPPERERVDLAQLARDIASELDALARTRGVQLRVDLRGAAVVLGDRGDLRRAIGNLAANALENTPAGGTVTLDVGEDGTTARVTVADDGFGVPKDVRATLFARFANSSRTTGGTGLGLYLVRRVAEEAGGRIEYEPRQPRGSTFSLSLPRAPLPA